MSGMTGGFSQQSKQARSLSDDNLGGGHGGEYRSAQAAYYTDPKTAAKFKKQAAAQEAAKQKRIEDAQKKREEIPLANTKAARTTNAEITQADREKLLEQEQAELDAKRRKRVVETSQNPVAISAAQNIEPYKINPQNNKTVKIINVSGSFATPKSFVTQAITLSRDGFIVRMEVMPAAKIKFQEFVQKEVKRLKLSAEHAARIIVADRTVKQSEKFNPDQVAVGDVSQDVRESAKGASSDPLRGLE